MKQLHAAHVDSINTGKWLVIAFLVLNARKARVIFIKVSAPLQTFGWNISEAI